MKGLADNAEVPILAADDIGRVAEFYGVDTGSEAVPNARGLVNRTYELGDSHFLTVFNARTSDELEAVAEVANGTDPSLPVVRPLAGQGGYCLELDTGNALLVSRLPGRHYVGQRHTDKQPIPMDVHHALASFFPMLQHELSAAPSRLKARLEGPSRPTIGVIPDSPPPQARILEPHAPDGPEPRPGPSELVHDDLERQNILSEQGRITGLTDLDSIRQGDRLYEFGHFMFNVVFCDPEPRFDTADMYIRRLDEAGMIGPGDMDDLHKNVYRFAVSDLADFDDLNRNPPVGRGEAVDLGLLASQYERALYFAARFFEREYPA